MSVPQPCRSAWHGRESNHAMYLLGVDIGTSGVKALLIDESGAVVASASESYPLYTPRPLWAEQNPDDWWQGTCTAIQRARRMKRI